MAQILLVDDEKVARAVYGDALAQAGHHVHAVSSVADAKAALAARQIDLVVTDLILPSGDGMEILQHVKERWPDVEVVVITALDRVDPAVRAIKSGAAEYLVKPVAPEALRHAVARALTTRQLLRENAALRRHVALVESGQRLLGQLDRTRVASAAASAFMQRCPARGAMVYTRSGDRFRLDAFEGIPGHLRDALDVELDARLPSATSERFAFVPAAGGGRAVAFPAVAEGAVRAWAVALLDGEEPEGLAATGEYLAQHLALAIHHVDRFSHVEDLAYLDDLTRLYNARYLDQALDRELATAGQRPFSLLFLDLDHFKEVNDAHGHLVGSKLLVETARVVKSCTRDVDVVARFGGDEYVVLLRETDSGGALKVAERIRRAIEAHSFLAREGYGLSVTTCVGVASFPEHASEKRSLLDVADRAMYRGKRSSRNVVYVASAPPDAPAAASARPRSGAA